MKNIFNKQNVTIASVTLAACLLFTSTASAQFSGVKWSTDKSNSPEQDKSGSGSTPSTKGATNNSKTFTFKISTSSTSGTQRQEFKYERRKGYAQMQVEFRIDTKYKNFDRIGLVQNHDDQTGSKGVFSIYQVRKSGSNYVFGVFVLISQVKVSQLKLQNFMTVLSEFGEKKLKAVVTVKVTTKWVYTSYLAVKAQFKQVSKTHVSGLVRNKIS